MSVVDDYRKAKAAIDAAVYEAIDRKGYVPCSMATATRNATVTVVLGVECYSKTDVVNQLLDDALWNGRATSNPVGILTQCLTSPIPAGVTTANQRM